MSPDLAVVTIVRGRLDHLAVQEAALAAQPTPYQRVVVRMGGPSVRAALDDDVTVVDMDGDARLPLAAARNRGAAATTAPALVFLDVDCIPSPSLLARYADALARVGGVVSGPVGYLPPGATNRSRRPAALARMAEPHPARPVPEAGTLLPESRYELLWSLSFAIGRADWDRVGGFCETYTGYGGEDTDFAWRVRREGLPFHWVGGAWAWHQHHPVSDPPREHLEDIVRNSSVFHRRWREWPMQGWLQAFSEAGLIEWDPAGTTCTLVGSRRRADRPPETLQAKPGAGRRCSA